MTKPYQIEIFDRSFNFKYNYLVDVSDFEYSEDALDPEKNTVVVPSDFRAVALKNAAITAPKGWFIRIIGNKHEFQGVITDLTEDKHQSTITYSNLLSLFDLNVVTSITAITESTIENYIKNQLVSAFVTNTDVSQRLTGLSAGSIAISSSTTGTLAFTSTDDPYVSIHLINDLIVDAFNTYGIFTAVSLNFKAKTINVSIGKVADSTLSIEGDLPNISDATFTIRSSDKEVNKVLVWDDERNQQTEYYLHPDGTFDKVNSNRITPVVNKVIIIHAQTLGEAKINDKYNAWIDAFEKYAERDENLNDSELAELRTAAANLDSVIAAYKPFYPYGVTATSTTNPNIPEDVTETFKAMYDGGTVTDGQGWSTIFDHFTFRFRHFGLDNDQERIHGWWTVNNTKSTPFWDACRDTWSGTDLAHKGVFDSDSSRAEFVEMWSVEWQGVYDGQSHTTGTLYYRSFMPINGNTARQAYNKYKETQAWRNEIEAAVHTIFDTTADEKAKETFASNKYSNLIELTVNEDDSMINPHDLRMGQVVNVIHDGKSYNSILSGRQVAAGKIKLIFGTIRLELTKYLKGRY